MMEKPKKERRFLKTLGKIGEILIQEVLLKVGSNLIKRIGGKKTLPSILFLFLSISLFAQYPNTGNKQRLGFQTSADGLVYRGRASDTVGIKSSGLNNAYFILDTVNNILYNYIKTKGGWKFSNGDTVIINNNFTQPVDSLFFKTSVPPNNVDTAKMRWDSELGTVVLGMYDAVPNELGFKNFWLVKNQTGSTITKNSLVYASGTVGSSGRISVSKFIANGTIDAKYLLGITAHDLSNGEDGYVISFGKIRQVKTDTFAAGAILYPSPTVAGVWTDVEPVAPNFDMPIGFCINSHVNNGTIAIRVASGYKLNELHDVQITSPVDRASLYYRGGLWRDTTTALLVSDTTSMLLPYFKKSDTTSLNLVSRFNTKLNLSDTLNMLTPYLRKADTTAMLLPYFRDADTTSLNLVSRFAAKQNTLNGTGFVKASGTNITFDNSTYLTTSSAASTYLPLTGGTVSGLIRRQEGNFNDNPNTFYFNILNYCARPNNNNTTTPTAQITFTDRPGTNNFPNAVRTSDIHLITARNLMGGVIGVYPDTTFSVVANDDGGRVGISKLNPAYKLDVNGTFNASGNSLIGGTLGVTGATTLTGALTVNNATVLNEGSGDFDTRIESDGNANMVFVDASTDRVGIGTGSPSKTLDVNGEVRISTVSTPPTSLLGKDGSNVVGEVTTVAQTGLMTRGETTATTGTPSAIFTVTHGLGSNPSAVIVTSAGIGGGDKIIFEVYTKSSTTFSVQAWNLDGTEASSKSVKIYWLAIK